MNYLSQGKPNTKRKREDYEESCSPPVSNVNVVIPVSNSLKRNKDSTITIVISKNDQPPVENVYDVWTTTSRQNFI